MQKAFWLNPLPICAASTFFQKVSFVLSLLDFDFATNPNPAYSANRKHLTTRLSSLQVWGCCDALSQTVLRWRKLFMASDFPGHNFIKPHTMSGNNEALIYSYHSSSSG